MWRLFPRKLIHQSQRAHRKDRSEFLRIEIGGEAHVQGPLSEVQPYAALQRPIIELNIQVGNSESRVVPARVEPNDIRKQIRDLEVFQPALAIEQIGLQVGPPPFAQIGSCSGIGFHGAPQVPIKLELPCPGPRRSRDHRRLRPRLRLPRRPLCGARVWRLDGARLRPRAGGARVLAARVSPLACSMRRRSSMCR